MVQDEPEEARKSQGPQNTHARAYFWAKPNMKSRASSSQELLGGQEGLGAQWGSQVLLGSMASLASPGSWLCWPPKMKSKAKAKKNFEDGRAALSHHSMLSIV